MEIKEDRSIAFQSLEKKVQKSKEIIIEAERSYDKGGMAVLWTGDKDSTILLHLIRNINENRIPYRVIFIDTTVFFDELYDFIKKLQDEWWLDLITLQDENSKELIESKRGKDECCYLLRTKVLEDAIIKYGIRVLLTARRWDGDSEYANEEYFSEFENHIKINPLLHFMEKDIQEYISVNNIPYCELYDKGYRKITCLPCAETIEKGHENKEEIIERLRSLGYF